MNIIAIGISIISLFISILVFYTNLRNSKLQKMADLKQIADEVYWSMKYRLSDFEKILNLKEETEDNDLIKKLEDGIETSLSRVDFYDKKYIILKSWFGFYKIKYQDIEDWSIDLKRIRTSVDFSRKELYYDNRI